MGLIKLPVEVSRRQLLRSLGYPRGKAPTTRVEERVDALGEVCRDLVQARGLVRLLDAADAGELGVGLNGAPMLGLGVCTVGPGLEAESARRAGEDQPLDALILDAYGSAAAEVAADALNFKLCAEARAAGVHPGARFSPGYPGWDITAQTPLLALLGADALGISLTESLMMLPRKSVSFATRLRPGAPTARNDSARRCARCGMTKCAYREEESP